LYSEAWMVGPSPAMAMEMSFAYSAIHHVFNVVR